MTRRLRISDISGTLAVDISNSDTTIESTDLADTRIPDIAAPWILPIFVTSDTPGNPPEIMWITAHTTGETTATVTRAAEYPNDTGMLAAEAHTAGANWYHGVTPADFKPEYVMENHAVAGDALQLSRSNFIILQADVENISPIPNTSTVDLFLVQSSPGGVLTSTTGITVFWPGAVTPTLSASDGLFDHLRLTSLDPEGTTWMGEVVSLGNALP